MKGLEKKFHLNGKTIGFYQKTQESQQGEGGGGTQATKWQEWSKDFFGFEIFNFGIFLGREILASILLGVAWFK